MFTVDISSSALTKGCLVINLYYDDDVTSIMFSFGIAGIEMSDHEIKFLGKEDFHTYAINIVNDVLSFYLISDRESVQQTIKLTSPGEVKKSFVECVEKINGMFEDLFEN